jgi:hypothetical protein
MTDGDETPHPAPVWGDRADAVVLAAAGAAGGPPERLPARRVAERRYEVLCIPFAADLALGDVVVTDGDRHVVEVLRPSGRAVFRVRVDASSTHARGEVARDLRYLGALLEWSSPVLLAVDAADPAVARAVDDYLAGRELRGDLLYARAGT